MKHVVIDARLITSSGIGRFLQQLLDVLIHDIRFRLTLLGDRSVLRRYAADEGRVSLVHCNPPLYSIQEQISLLRAIPKCDLFYAPHYVVPLLYRGPYVVTVNDVVHLERADFAPGKIAQLYARFMIVKAVRRAQRVVTLSEYSKKQIAAVAGVPENHIEVVYPAVAPIFFTPLEDRFVTRIRDQYGLKRPYLLFVGNAKRHKNLQTLVRALAALGQLGPEYLLGVVGEFRSIRSSIDELRRLVHELNLTDSVRFLGNIPDDELVAVYRGAHLFVFPSLAEGFGLPPLEAMACGIPVLAARMTATPEVCGDAAEYYGQPEDPRSLADAVRTLDASPHRRLQLISLGAKRARQFAGSESTHKIVDLLYRS